MEGKVDKQDHWDLEIRPSHKLFDVNLKEAWRYRELVFVFIGRDFAAQYKQTLLGPIWHLVQPILTTLVFLLVFGRIAHIPTDGINPILFYMSGISIWNYFSTTLTGTSNTFIQNAPIFGKVYFPRIVTPISISMSNIVRFGIQFLLLLAMMFWFWLSDDVGITFSWLWLLIPFLVFVMAGLAMGMGIVISSLTTKYRDFSVLLTFAIQLYMYATPIVYPLSFAQTSRYGWLISLNPLTPLVEAFRYCLFGAGTFTLSDLAYSCGFMLFILAVGLLLFNKAEKTFIDTV